MDTSGFHLPGPERDCQGDSEGAEVKNRWSRFRYYQDPVGFDDACMRVARGDVGVNVTSWEWQCGTKRIRDRVVQLTGKPHEKLRISVVVRKPKEQKLTRKPLELAKRERLRQELQAMLEQPYRVAA